MRLTDKTQVSRWYIKKIRGCLFRTAHGFFVYVLTTSAVRMKDLTISILCGMINKMYDLREI